MKKRRYKRSILRNNRGEVNASDDDEEDDDEDDGITVDDDDTGKKKEEEENDDEENDDGSLTIDLDDDATKKEKEEKAWAKMRVENKKLKEEQERLKSEMASMRVQQTHVPTPPQRTDVPRYKGHAVPQTEDEWNQLAQKDWKLAVDMRSHQQAEEIVRQTTQVTQNNSVLEKSKSRVLERHPELNDQGTEKSRIYMKILQENPSYLNDPKGPVHAMRDMEEYMEDVLGYERAEIVKARKAGAKKEQLRSSRAELASSTGRTVPRAGNTVTLSKDELEFCKFNGIDPKEYAKNKKRVGRGKTNGGIQV